MVYVSVGLLRVGDLVCTLMFYLVVASLFGLFLLRGFVLICVCLISLWFMFCRLFWFTF